MTIFNRAVPFKFNLAGTGKNIFHASLDTIAFTLFFLWGIALMYVGYFTPYSGTTFALYVAAMLLGGLLYIVYAAFRAAPENSLYFWLVMFLFFPKKEIPARMPSLFNVGFGFAEASGSLYYVLDIVLIFALVVCTIRRLRSDGIVDPPVKTKCLWVSFLLVGSVGVLHVFLMGRHAFIPGLPAYGGYFMSFWPLVDGMIVFSACFVLLRHPKQFEKICMILLAASALLFIEYGLARFSHVLPEKVVFYSLNYRGAFRSTIASGDLFVGQLMIMGVAASLYFHIVKRAWIYLVLALLYSVVLVETFNRCSIFALLVMLAALIPRTPRFAKASLAGLLIAVILLPEAMSFINSFSASPAPASLSASKVDGMLGTASTLDRIGAIVRGLDVFLLYPVLGVGPGQLVGFMSAPVIPSVIDSSALPLAAAWFYDQIATGAHPTGPHNLLVRFMGEYGITGFAAGLFAVYWLASSYLALLMQNRHARASEPTVITVSISHAALLGYGTYFMFQAEPMIFGLLFLLVRTASMDSSTTSPHPIAVNG